MCQIIYFCQAEANFVCSDLLYYREAKVISLYGPAFLTSWLQTLSFLTLSTSSFNKRLILFCDYIIDSNVLRTKPVLELRLWSSSFTMQINVHSFNIRSSIALSACLHGKHNQRYLSVQPLLQKDSLLVSIRENLPCSADL